MTPSPAASAPSSTLARAYGAYRAIWRATIVFSLCINLLMFTGPLYMLQIYDRVLASRSQTTLAAISVLAVGLLVAYGALEFARARMLMRAGVAFDRILAHPLFVRCAQAELEGRQGGARGALHDADTVRAFLTGPGVLAVLDVPWTPLFVGLCFAFHPWLGGVAGIGAGVVVVLAAMGEMRARPALRRASAAGGAANRFAWGALEGAETARAMGMTEALGAHWQAHRRRQLAAQADAGAWTGGVWAVSKFVRATLQVAILGVGAVLALRQEISPGIMIAASIVAGRALAPLEAALGQWRAAIAAHQAHARLGALFAESPPAPVRTRLDPPTGRLDVAGLSAASVDAAPACAPVLHAVSVSLAPGEVLAVVGPSGAGKSTLARHIVGVCAPALGTVRLDGIDLRHWAPDQRARAIGYLPQDTRLFAGTVAENIARFAPDARDADIVAAARLAGVHEMIAGLGMGYQTPVGASGTGLPGGQRQRLGLARAVYARPPLVVLDEPDAHLDSAGETALAGCLKRLRAANTTVVVITHKASLLPLSDHTLILNAGRVQRLVRTADLLHPRAGAEDTAGGNTAAAGRGGAVQGGGGRAGAMQGGAIQDAATGGQETTGQIGRRE